MTDRKCVLLVQMRDTICVVCGAATLCVRVAERRMAQLRCASDRVCGLCHADEWRCRLLTHRTHAARCASQCREGASTLCAAHANCASERWHLPSLAARSPHVLCAAGRRASPALARQEYWLSRRSHWSNTLGLGVGRGSTRGSISPVRWAQERGPPMSWPIRSHGGEAFPQCWEQAKPFHRSFCFCFFV